jgi:hypothetical protein
MRLVAWRQVTGNGNGLDPVVYSRYKYGQSAAIAYYAAELGRLVVAALPVLTAEPSTVTAPGSRAVPIGADLLADGVLRHVNRVRAGRQLEPAVRAKLHRHHIPAGDYGGEDRAAREALLAAEKISSIPELFTDRHVVVVDDLWVTGTSAAVTAAAIDRWRPASLTYLVIGRVEPALAERRPQVEAELNHAAVDGLPALAQLLRAGPVAVNQRLCKFVAGQPVELLGSWLTDQEPRFVWRLYQALLAEGIGLMPAYRDAVAVLVEFVDKHRLDERAAAEGWTAGPQVAQAGGAAR